MCPIDIEKGAWHDMTCKRVQRLILTWVRSGRLWLIHLGTPVYQVECSPNYWHSRTRRRPRVRAVHGAAPPRLSPIRRALHPRESESIRSLEVAAARRRAAPGVGPFRQLPAVPVRTPYKKPTTLSASDHTFDVLTRTCACSGHRECLQGLVHVGGKWRWKTSLASAYPPLLARSYAAVAESVAPRSAWRNHGSRKLDLRWEEAMAAAFHSRQAKAVLGSEARAIIIERGPPLCPSRYVLPWRGAPRRMD